MGADELRATLDSVDGSRRAGFELVLRPENALDPSTEPAAARRTLDDLRAAGATIVNIRLVSESRDQWIDQLARLMGLAEG
jgi:hypothetical protein